MYGRADINWALFVALTLVGCAAPERLPDELMQVWRNPSPGYRDRYLELREDTVIFGTGDYAFKLHAIERVASNRVGERIEFTIGYRAEDGATVPLYLVLTPGSPPSLQIGQRKDRWIPEKHVAWPREAG